MQKKIILISLILLNSILLFSESLFNNLPGSYVIYNDERFNDQAYIGILYLGDDTLLVRTYEEENSYEFAFIVKLKVVDGEIEFDDEMQILAGGLNDSTTTKRIFPMILNWGNAWFNNKEKISDNYSHIERSVDLYSFLYWIPVFNIETIENDPEFKLLTVGTVQDINDPAFAQFTGIPEISNSDSFRIIAGNSKKSYIPGLDMTLDNNWIEGEDGIFRIQMKTVQDAALFVEDISLEGTPFSNGYDIAKYFMLANSGGIVLADESRIITSSNSIIMENQVFDPRTGAVSFQRKKIIQGNNMVSIITFASFLDLYNENISYFDALLK